MKLPADDMQIISLVQAHLQQLSPFFGYKADEAILCAGSNSLRFLLSYGNLNRAWYASNIGGPMTFRTWCIASRGPKPVVAFCGGGDVLPGIPFSACRNASLVEKTLDLKAFCHVTRIQVDDQEISTLAVVDYVANALGGSHFDPEGRATKKRQAILLKKIENNEIQGPPFRVNGRSLLHHEILSIGQAVLNSPEVASLRKLRID